MKRSYVIALVLIAAAVAVAGRLLEKPPRPEPPSDDSDLRDLTADMGRTKGMLGVGEWSQPVTDSAGYTLRGRLLLFQQSHSMETFPNSPPTEYWRSPPVYLELQNLSPRKAKSLAVYFALQDGLVCQVRDGNGRPPSNSTWGMAWDGPITPVTRQQWTTVPFDGSVRVRADVAAGHMWPGRTNLYFMFGWSSTFDISTAADWYLSGSFSPPTNHPAPPGVHVWNGVLNLPPVKIPALNP